MNNAVNPNYNRRKNDNAKLNRIYEVTYLFAEHISRNLFNITITTIIISPVSAVFFYFILRFVSPFSEVTQFLNIDQNGFFVIFLFLTTFIYVSVLSVYFERHRHNSASIVEDAQNADHWNGKGAVKITAPSQGIFDIFANAKELSRHLDQTSLEIRDLKFEAEHANAPAFITTALEGHASNVEHISDEIDTGEHGAAADYEKLLEDAAICHPKSTIGTFIYGADTKYVKEDGTLQLRLLALTMFFKTETTEDTYQALSSRENYDALYAWAPDLKDGGQFRVLYELSLNTGRALAEINREKDEIKALKNDLQQALDNARATLKLKPAANRWQRSARISSLLALIGLAPFLFLLLGVPWVVWANWGEVSATISTIFHAADPETKAAIATWQGFFKDAPWATFVFVTVPVLMFAWTLKHFSRIFVQNMNLASDASRRAALADVYTRIVSDPDLNQESNRITDEQKKIIFEAMFRPRDPRHTDDGIDHSPIEKIVATVKKETN